MSQKWNEAFSLVADLVHAEDARTNTGGQEIAALGVLQTEFGAGYRARLFLDNIRCDILDTGWPLGDDTDPELTPRRLVQELLSEIAFMRHQRDNVQAARERQRARERFLRQESVLLTRAQAALDAAHEELEKTEAAIEAAVVEYLRAQAESIRRGEHNPANRENALLDAADAIERGEYREAQTEVSDD